MVKIKVDGIEYSVDEKRNLIDAVKEVGIEIPCFCYHPALSIVGMCRMCLIEIEGVPKVQAACNTPVKEGLSIVTKSKRVKEAREGTMEFLLANHPLDCPVCDKAGECDLQNNSFGSGKSASVFEFEKRDIPQEEIGDNLLINHNRCIVCVRCVRFETEHLKDPHLGLFERGNHSLIGLANDKVIHHNYQGALADICPVGALLNKKTLFKSRVWWYKSFKSICHGCSTGCNVETNVRDNKMYRYMTRENRELGMYFICDKGRFDLDWMNENRLMAYYQNGTPSESGVVIPKIIEKLKLSKSLVILGGAHETNENLEIIKKESAKLSKEVIIESRIDDSQLKPTEQVDFLLTKDYHPNTKGAVDLGLTSKKSLTDIIKDFNNGSIDVIILLKEEIPKDLKVNGKGTVIVLDTNLTLSVKNAHFAVPIQIFAEQIGSFTNKNGIKQSFEKSLNPVNGLPTSGEFFNKLSKELSKKEEAKVGNR